MEYHNDFKLWRTVSELETEDYQNNGFGSSPTLGNPPSLPSPLPQHKTADASVSGAEDMLERVMGWFADRRLQIGNPERIQDSFRQAKTKLLREETVLVRDNGKGLISRRVGKPLTIDF